MLPCLAFCCLNLEVAKAASCEVSFQTGPDLIQLYQRVIMSTTNWNREAHALVFYGFLILTNPNYGSTHHGGRLMGASGHWIRLDASNWYPKKHAKQKTNHVHPFSPFSNNCYHLMAKKNCQINSFSAASVALSFSIS